MTVALESLLASARVVSIALTTPFRQVIHREALLFCGPQGWAEWSPFLEYADDEAAVWLAAAIDFAFEQQPNLVRDSIGINATLPAVTSQVVAQTLAPFGNFNTVKIKVAQTGETLAQDIARITEVNRLFPAVKIRLDANGGYEVSEASRLLNALSEAGLTLDYFEQPVRTLDELAAFRTDANRQGYLVAADESVRKAADPMAVAAAHAADLLVIKAAPLGGIRAALKIVSQSQLPAVVSSALETSVGISMGLHLAGALPNLNHDCGLGTVALMTDDVCEDPLIPNNGTLAVRRVVPSEAKLKQLAASAERTAWWLARLERCHKLLK